MVITRHIGPVAPYWPEGFRPQGHYGVPKGPRANMELLGGYA